MRAVWLTLLVACGGSDRPEPAAPGEPAVDCAGAAANAASLADTPSRDAVRAVVAIRCTEDHWSRDAADCIARSKDRDDGHRCVFRELTKEQSDRLMQDVRSAIDASVAPTGTTEPETPPGDDGSGLRVTDLYPSRGEPAGGTFVILRGVGFTDEERTATVRFGSTAANVIRIQSDSELVVRAPAGTGTVDVAVTFMPGGERVIPAAFTYANEAPPAKAGSAQAQLAVAANKEGEALVMKKRYDEAAEKFRDAAERSPEAIYFLNLCNAYYHVDRLDDALAACEAVNEASPTKEQVTRADALVATIQAEAKRQGATTSP